MSGAEFRPPIRVMSIDRDVSRFEQHDYMLRQIGERVDVQLRVGEQHRAGLGNCESGADDGEVDIGAIAAARAISRSPPSSGTVEQMTLASAIFVRTGG